MLFTLVLTLLFVYWLYRYVEHRRLVSHVTSKGFHVVARFLPISIATSVFEAFAPSFLGDALETVVEHKTQVFIAKVDDALLHTTKPVAMVMGNKVNVYTADADVSKAALGGDVPVGKYVEVYDMLRFFGDNVVTTRGQEWKRHRQVCTVAFSRSNLKLVKTATVKHCRTLLAGWRRLAESNNGTAQVTFGGHDDLMDLTLRVFGESIFGRSMETTSESNAPDSFQGRFMLVNEYLLMSIVFPSWLLKRAPSKIMRTLGEATERLRDDVVEMLETAEKDIEAANAGDESVLGKDLLSSLARANARTMPLTRQESLANVYMFSLAAMETSAHTLSWSICRLAFHPDIQERLRQEAMTFVDHFEEITTENAAYIFAFIYEILRLHSPVNHIPQKALEAVELAGKVSLEKDWGLYVSALAMHLRPEYWGADAQEFKPSRFFDNPSLSSSPAFAPFSLGPRMCIGKQVALLEMAVSLAMIVTSFQVTPLRPLSECLRWKYKITREFASKVPYSLKSLN